MTGEFELAVRFLELEVDDLRHVTLRAIDAAFCDDETKQGLRRQVDSAYATDPESG